MIVEIDQRFHVRAAVAAASQRTPDHRVYVVLLCLFRRVVARQSLPCLTFAPLVGGKLASDTAFIVTVLGCDLAADARDFGSGPQFAHERLLNDFGHFGVHRILLFLGLRGTAERQEQYSYCTNSNKERSCAF